MKHELTGKSTYWLLLLIQQVISPLLYRASTTSVAKMCETTLPLLEM